MTQKPRIPLLAEFRFSIFTLFATAALTLLACSDENLSGDDSEVSKVRMMQKASSRVDMEEAISQVEEAIAFLDKAHPSESKSKRRVNSVSVLLSGGIKSSMMKSGEYSALGISDTLAYVFNFKDSLGYVIISNDTRVKTPLLAFTEKGSLVNGQTDNPGLIVFLERLEGYVLESIIKSGKTDEQKINAAGTKGHTPVGIFFPTLVGPLIPVEWGQGNPFNNNLEEGDCYGSGTANNGRVWAGCVATATAQIMSYWEHPTTLGSSWTYPWTTLNNYKRSSDFDPYPTDTPIQKLLKTIARYQVADLFQQIDIKVNMLYGCHESTAYTLDAIKFLLDNGYRLYYGNVHIYGNTYWGNYDWLFVYQSLMADIPLIARGCNVNGKCHAWIIDGLALGYTYLPSKDYYVHNNWGWDGDANGYYLAGFFDPLNFNFQRDVKISAVYR